MPPNADIGLHDDLPAGIVPRDRSAADWIIEANQGRTLGARFRRRSGGATQAGTPCIAMADFRLLPHRAWIWPRRARCLNICIQIIPLLRDARSDLETQSG